MKRTAFGDPRPANLEEMEEAMMQCDMPAHELHGTVRLTEDEGHWDGWTAEVLDNESGEEAFITLGYADKDQLLSDLTTLGIKYTVEKN